MLLPFCRIWLRIECVVLRTTGGPAVPSWSWPPKITPIRKIVLICFLNEQVSAVLALGVKENRPKNVTFVQSSSANGEAVCPEKMFKDAD